MKQPNDGNQPEWSPDTSGLSPLPALDLRPLSTGELLDRVFFLYRSRILLFLVIALVPACLGLLSNGAQLLLPHYSAQAHGSGAAAYNRRSLAWGAAVFVSSLLALAGYAISQAATTRMVAEIYLGNAGEPAGALRAAWPHTLRYIGIELWKAWSALWLPLLLSAPGFALLALRHRMFGGNLLLLAVASMVFGVIAYLRNSLAIPASVIENLKVRAAMRRTKTLVSGTAGNKDGRKWRIFLLYLLLLLLYVVAGVVQSPLLLLVAHTKAPTQHAVALGLQLALAFVIALLLSPVASIALCLFYFDERVRREAFDLDFLLRGSDAVPHAQPGIGEEAMPRGSA